MNVRQLWKAKLERGELAPAATPSGAPRRAKAGPASAALGGAHAPANLGGFAGRASFAGQVLGIDPSLRGTGLALIEFSAGQAPLMLSCRTVTVARKYSMPEALAEIHRAVTWFLDNFAVRHVALEQSIYVQNFQTAQILGSARGAAMAAVALRELPVFEYAPARIKQAVVGTGRASKEQMAQMVRSLLGHGAAVSFDEADAAGAALCHAFTWTP